MELSAGWLLLIVFIAVTVLLVTGMWVGLSIGILGLVMLLWLANANAGAVGEIMWVTLNSYILAAVPMFVFMGGIVLKSGMGDRLYTGATKLTRFIPGGLIQANIVSCAVFAAICGSGVATTATIGTVAIPEQKKRGYARRIVLGSITAGGTLGPMIPPSIGMILYGAYINYSVAALFIGTTIPGIIQALLFMIYIYIVFKIRPSTGPPQERFSKSYFLQAISAFKDMWPVGVIMFIIFGGIYGGVMTPTEAAAVSGFVAVCLAAIFKKLNIQMLKEASLSALTVTAMILLIIVSAKVLGNALSLLMIPRQLIKLVEASGLSPLQVWGVLVLVFLVLGCFMETLSIFFLTIGVVYPLMMSLGFHPIWFGVVFHITLEAGLLTPPFGVHLFVCQNISKEPFMEVVRGSFPFFLIMVVNIILLSFFPILTTWLPSILGW